MKDKVKGLIIGLSIGSLLAGSAAYASATQIEVAFKNLKFMFNGVEKKSADGQSFVYNNTTYVPLRFVGEALGQNVTWDEKNQTIWFGDKKAVAQVPVAAPVAIYKGGTISLKDFDTFIANMQLYNPDYSNSLTDPAFKEEMLNQIITVKELAKRGQALAAKTYKDEATAQLVQLKVQFAQVFGTEVSFAQRLKDLKLTEANVISNIQDVMLQNAYLTSKVTDAILLAEYNKGLSTNAYDMATVSHILISLTLEDGTTRTPADALIRANEVITKLNAGEKFEDLAKQYSDDTGSKATGGAMPSTNVNSWVAEFKQAVIDLQVAKVSEPVLSQFGYHIIRVEAKNKTTFEQAKEALNQSLLQQTYTNFITKELPGLITSKNLK